MTHGARGRRPTRRRQPVPPRTPPPRAPPRQLDTAWEAPPTPRAPRSARGRGPGAANRRGDGAVSPKKNRSGATFATRPRDRLHARHPVYARPPARTVVATPRTPTVRSCVHALGEGRCCLRSPRTTRGLSPPPTTRKRWGRCARRFCAPRATCWPWRWLRRSCAPQPRSAPTQGRTATLRKTVASVRRAGGVRGGEELGARTSVASVRRSARGGRGTARRGCLLPPRARQPPAPTACAPPACCRQEHVCFKLQVHLLPARRRLRDQFRLLQQRCAPGVRAGRLRRRACAHTPRPPVRTRRLLRRTVCCVQDRRHELRIRLGMLHGCVAACSRGGGWR